MYLVAEAIHNLRSINDWTIVGACDPDRRKELLADTALRRAARSIKSMPDPALGEGAGLLKA